MSDQFGYDDNKRNGNITICALWKTSNGHYSSVELDVATTPGYEDAASKAVQKALEKGIKGGKFLIRMRTQSTINKSNDPTKAPTAYLEFVPEEEVAAFKANKPVRDNVGL
jgi:hypothetical protein